TRRSAKAHYPPRPGKRYTKKRWRGRKKRASRSSSAAPRTAWCVSRHFPPPPLTFGF
ncbi:hypothetical protein C0993_005061, partial [Termitomyces sp. T159_Od127]